MTVNTINSFHSWLFTAGHDMAAALRLLESHPSVLVVDLEEFTPSQYKHAACINFKNIVAAAEAVGIACAIRLDSLEKGGLQQLAVIAAARPFAILLPQIEKPQQLQDLWQQMMLHDLQGVGIVPTIESQVGFANLEQILMSGPQISAVLLGTGDLAADLGLEKNPDRMAMLQQSRETFARLCQEYQVEAIDGPWPELVDPPQRGDDYLADCEFSRRAGFTSRCALTSTQTTKWQL